MRSAGMYKFLTTIQMMPSQLLLAIKLEKSFIRM